MCCELLGMTKSEGIKIPSDECVGVILDFFSIVRLKRS